MALTRREFLCRSFGVFGAAALAFERFGLLQAFRPVSGLQGFGLHIPLWRQ